MGGGGGGGGGGEEWEGGDLREGEQASTGSHRTEDYTRPETRRRKETEEELMRGWGVLGTDAHRR